MYSASYLVGCKTLGAHCGARQYLPRKKRRHERHSRQQWRP